MRSELNFENMRIAHWVTGFEDIKFRWLNPFFLSSFSSFSSFYFLLFSGCGRLQYRKFGIKFDTDVRWEWIAATMTATAREYLKVFNDDQSP